MSDGSVLRFVRLQVRRMPGIADPYMIDGLHPGINVVHGPNGSGKTTTARALELALWPALNSKDRRSIMAHYSFGSAEYVVDLDSDRVVVQADGKDADAPPLPEPDFRERYWLSLHELLLASDAGDKFASAIDRQSVGGYDLGAARVALKWRAKPSAATKQTAELEDARRKLKEAKDAQAAIHAEAGRLEGLEKRCQESQPAAAKKEVLDAALRHARARAERERAVAGCESFSPLHASIKGGEHTSWRELTERAANAAVKEKSESEHAASAEAQMRETFPESVISTEAMTALREDVLALERAEQARTSAWKNVEAAEAGLRETRRALGETITDEQLKRIDSAGIGDLADFAQKAEKHAAAIAAAKEEISLAGPGEAPSDLKAVRSGVEILGHWLTDGEPPSDHGSSHAHRKLITVVGSIAAAISVVLALWSTGALIGVLVAVTLVVLAARARQSEQPSMRPQRQKDYARLGLSSPGDWTTNAVVACLEHLCVRLADGQLAEKRVEWRLDATRRLQNLEALNQTVERQRAQLVSRFGVAPDTDARQLAWLAERIGRWQTANEKYAEAAAAFEACEKSLAELCDRLHARVGPFGFQRASNTSDARACVQVLDSRLQKYASATDARLDALRRADEARRECVELARQIEQLLRPGGAERLDAADLERLCDEHEAYEEARKALLLADQELENSRASLMAHAHFSEDLLHASESVLEERRELQASLQEGYTALLQTTEALKTRVADAKRGHDVEEALAEVAAAEAALASLRATDLEAMVGDALVQYLQDVSRDQHRPEVFRRAKIIFSKITGGRYLLDFQDGRAAGGASFRAIDQVTKVGHGLGELSSATRVQLLLAVRIAFVEAQEKGIRLPLFLDETLGTSDDVRAHAVIEAIFALAEEGRQIFYFTAQRDEVVKWTCAAKARGADLNVVDLVSVRSLPASDVELLFADLPETVAPLVPSPEGRTREEYADLVSVPPLSARAGGVAAAHLWYLVDDLKALHEFLSFGITTWGQLSTILAHGGLAFAAEHEKTIARATALARVLDTVLEELAIGRGRPVDRAALIESGAVSNVMLDPVMALVGRFHGDARDLIAALENREVAGFQTKKTAALREYLEGEGYLEAEAPRSTDEIRSAMLEAAASDIKAETLTRADLDALLISLRRQCGNAGDMSLASLPVADASPVLPPSEVALPA